MLDQSKPDGSYVRWADAFHPETAEAIMDPLIRQEHADNPWGAVWAEATLVTPQEEEEDKKSKKEEANEESPIVATATVVSIDADIHEHGLVVADPNGNPANNNDDESSLYHGGGKPWRHGNVLGNIVGFSFAIAAVFETFGVEVAATMVYLLAVAFEYVVSWCMQYPRNPMCLLLAMVFKIVVYVLLFCDTLLLSLNVLIAELLGSVTCLVVSLFDGPKQGKRWHQYIRKICHLTRWAMRYKWDHLQPARVFPMGTTTSTVTQEADSDTGNVV